MGLILPKVALHQHHSLLLAVGSAAGVALGVLASTVAFAHRLPGGAERPRRVRWCGCAHVDAGLAAAWIPAQGTLAVNPMILMREE